METGKAFEKLYTFDLDQSEYIKIKGNTVSYTDATIFLKCDVEKKTFELSRWSNRKRQFKKQNKQIEYGQELDLSDEGDRWEGSCVDGKPFGYGVLFDKDNCMVFSGFMYEEEKVCFGEEYYADNGVIEYRGMFVHNQRHGWGCLYDKKGELKYEGDWSFGRNDNFVVNIRNIKSDSELITNMVKELIIGPGDYEDTFDSFDIDNYSKLEKLEVGDGNFFNVGDFRVSNCHKLTQIDIGGSFMNYTGGLSDMPLPFCGRMIITNCKSLKTINLRNGAFDRFVELFKLKSNNYSFFEIDLPSLETLEIDDSFNNVKYMVMKSNY